MGSGESRVSLRPYDYLVQVERLFAKDPRLKCSISKLLENDNEENIATNDLVLVVFFLLFHVFLVTCYNPML